MANVAREQMPILARAAGAWVGTYTHTDPQGNVQDSYEVRTVSEFPEDGSCDYRLTSTNRWQDGRTEVLVNEAHFRDGRLWWSNGRLEGSIWEVDDFTIYLRFGYVQDPSIQVCEMIQVSHDGQHRARTWHWFRDEQLFRVTLVRERRETAD